MKIFGNNYNIIAFISILFLANILFLIKCFFYNELTFDGSFIAVLLLSIALEVLFCYIIYRAKTRHWKIENLFLVLGLSIGTLFVFALPLTAAPDEATHYLRIYEITKGHIITDTDETGTLHGSIEPLSLQYTINDLYQGQITYEQILSKFSIYESEEKAFVANVASGYSPINYLPHIVGMQTGRLLNLPIIGTAYIAKFLHMVTCIFILFFCIKLLPFFKSSVFLIAFFPIVMQSMSSLSADGFLISCSFLLISFVLHAIYAKNFKIKWFYLPLLLFLCLAVSIGKNIYAPVCLLLFAIPIERFGSQTKKYLSIFSLGAITLTILLLWLKTTPPLTSITDSSVQMDSLLHNPFGFLFILIKTIIIKSPNYGLDLFSRHLEWFNVALPIIYPIGLAILLFINIVKERKEYCITKAFKAFSIFAICFALLSSLTVMYLQWTTPGDFVIQGVQGRYFLPLLPLIALLFFKTKKPKELETPSPQKLPIYQNKYMYFFIIFTCINALSSIVCFHI